jgi:hypothetical protein
MGKLSYALEPGGPKRLTIDTHFAWKDSVVKVDGLEIGRIPDLKTLQNGLDFTLPDGSLLHIQYKYKVFYNEILITRNGQNLPGSQGDPKQKVKTASGVLYFVGGISVLIGIFSIFSEMLQEIGITWLSIVFGLVFLVLAFFTQRRSKAALIIAIVLYCLDTLSTIFFGVINGSNPVSAIIVRVLLLIPMIMGVGAINELKKTQQLTPPSLN